MMEKTTIGVFIRDEEDNEEKIFFENDDLTISAIKMGANVVSIELVFKDVELRNKMIIKLLRSHPYILVSDVHDFNDDEVLEYYTFKLSINTENISVYFERE